MAHLYSAVAKKAPVLPKVASHGVGKSYGKSQAKVAPSATSATPSGASKKGGVSVPHHQHHHGHHNGSGASPSHRAVHSQPAPISHASVQLLHTAHVPEHGGLVAHSFASPYQPAVKFPSSYHAQTPIVPIVGAITETPAYVLPPGAAPIPTSPLPSTAYVPQVQRGSGPIAGSSSGHPLPLAMPSASSYGYAPAGSRTQHIAQRVPTSLGQHGGAQVTPYHSQNNHLQASSSSHHAPQYAAGFPLSSPSHHPTLGQYQVASAHHTHHQQHPNFHHQTQQQQPPLNRAQPLASSLESHVALPTTPEPGMIVEFLADDGSYRLGLVDKAQVTEGEKETEGTWLVTNATSRGHSEQLSLSSSRITFCWPKLYNSNSYRFALDDLIDLSETIQADIETRRSSMPINYAKWVDANRRSINVTTAANILFEHQALPHEIYVTHRILQESHAFVRAGKLHPGTSIVNEYTLNSLSVMSSMSKLYSKEKESIERKLFLHRFGRKLWAAEQKTVPLSTFIANLPELSETERSFNLNWNPHQDSHYLNKLKTYAFADDISDINELQMIKEQLLDPLGIEADSKAVFDVLVKIGVFGRYENPFIGRHNGKLDFTAVEKKAFRAQAAQLQIDRDSKLRRDYRNCGPVFAIDSRLESDEIDDAVGLFRAPDGTTWVHIHIADPSRFVHPNDTLDLLARQRVQSLFIPEKVATMFPANFSRQHFSLLPDKTNYAFTFAVQLNPSTGQVMNYDISPSFIDKVVAMTYDQADDLLVAASRKEAPTLHKPVPASQVAALNTLLELSEVRRRHRERAGAVFLDQPRPEVEVADSGEIVKVAAVRDSESLTRGMVSEFMILVGEVTAMFASRHSIPIPFRSQAKRPSPNGFVPQGSAHLCPTTASAAVAPLFEPPVSPLKNSRPKTPNHGTESQPRLFPAVTDVNPGEHAGLGLPAYCQATSPIRRYTDLLVHHQIKSYLRGESLPFSSSKISSMISQLEATQLQLNSLSNNSNRYWILRFLERQDPARVYEALVAGDSMFGVQCAVWLLELGWKTSFMVDSGRSPVRGEKVKVRVHHVDAFKDEIVLMEDTPTPSSAPPPSPL